jgi:branched-chain amino acid transport system substrate-binding protein
MKSLHQAGGELDSYESRRPSIEKQTRGVSKMTSRADENRVSTRRRGKRTAIAVTLVAAAFLTSASISGVASASSSDSQKLTTNLGNGAGGKLVTQANQIAKNNLVGPKGSGLTRGITDSTITIGCVVTSQSYPGFQQGIQARVAAANKQKIAGRTIKVLPCKDDGGSVQSTTQANQSLVTQNDVFAVLALSDTEVQAPTNFLNQNQVPFFGWGYEPGFCGTRWGFGWNGCIAGNAVKEPIEAISNANVAGAMLKAANLKPSQVRFAAQGNTAAGELGNAQFSALYQALGAKVVYSKADYPTTSSGVDNTPYVQSIMASKPNIVYLSLPFAAIGPLASALKAAGYKGAIMDYDNYVPGLLATSPQLASALQGEYVTTQVVPYEQNTPYIKEIKANLASIGDAKELTLGSFMGYAEADMFIGMLQAVGKNLNTKTFDQKINGGGYVSFKNSMPGGLGKLVWPAGHYLPADCAAVVQVKGTGYRVAQPFTCLQSYKVG